MFWLQWKHSQNNSPWLDKYPGLSGLRRPDCREKKYQLHLLVFFLEVIENLHATNDLIQICNVLTKTFRFDIRSANSHILTSV